MEVDVDVSVSFTVSVIKNNRALVCAPLLLRPARPCTARAPAWRAGSVLRGGATRARGGRFDCSSDGSYVEIEHVSLVDEAVLHDAKEGDTDTYEGPARPQALACHPAARSAALSGMGARPHGLPHGTGPAGTACKLVVCALARP